MIDYEVLPHVIDPAEAIAPGAPILHRDKTPAQHRVADGKRNIVAETHGEYGDVAAALAPSAVTYEGTFTTQRVQHAALETHGGLAWVDADGVLNVRSSHAGAVPDPSYAGRRSSIFHPTRSACSASASAAVSAASRRCSSRISWRWPR